MDDLDYDRMAEAMLEAQRRAGKRRRKDEGSATPELAKCLRSARERAALSLRELAVLAKVHHTTIQKIEAGERGMSLLTFAKLASGLDLKFVFSTLAAARGDAPPPPPPPPSTGFENWTFAVKQPAACGGDPT